MLHARQLGTSELPQGHCEFPAGKLAEALRTQESKMPGGIRLYLSVAKHLCDLPQVRRQ